MVAHAELPTRYGRFTIYGFEGRGPQEEAVALVRGKFNGKTAPLVRVHSQCLTGDVLTSLRCDCRAQLELSLQKIGRAPSGDGCACHVALSDHSCDAAGCIFCRDALDLRIRSQESAALIEGERVGFNGCDHLER